MTETERRITAKAFATAWKGKGDEKQETQRFWLSLLRNVYGVEKAEDAIEFERRVEVDNSNGTTTTKYIDCYIRQTRTLIEQKGIKIDLSKGEIQSDGANLRPYQQARRYGGALPNAEQPRWIVVCNFQTFEIHDMNRPNEEPEVVALADLEREYHRLNFLVDTGNENIKKEMEISLQAGQLVGVLYDALLKQYIDPDSSEALKSLNALCVRLVFCLYAEDAGIFGRHLMFHDYLQAHRSEARQALINLFRVLDTRVEERDPYLDDDLLAFPYVNGGLFADENIIIPKLDEGIVDLILHKASEDFDWSDISPTIFGAVFESTLNPETRRSGGMHYTSIENIHKVIDPLFLDDLKAELEEIKTIKVEKTRNEKLRNFQLRCAELRFLDPACGSGNFLTETYLCLRHLENEVIAMLLHNQMVLEDETVNPIKVSIDQFYGIEINDFAVSVAKTALWIAESQMMEETAEIVASHLDFLPLKTNAHIVEGNALRLDWESVVPKDKLSYIMGNPPFVGFTYMTATQKEDMQSIFPDVRNLDFVSAWYKIASDFIQETKIECGFVSTNSITQGETVSSLWRFLNVCINFAYRTFIWESEAKIKAHVHCVIIGFAAFDRKFKLLYQEGQAKTVQNINAYLCDAPNVIIASRSKPLCNIPQMIYGNKPADGGHLIIEDSDYLDFVASEPQARRYIKPLLGAVEYLHGKKRWCLWLEGISPGELKKCPLVYQRVEQCKKAREDSVAAAIRKFAETPMLFAQRTQPVGKPYIIVPRVSSERRRYVPMGFIDGDTIVSDAVQIVPDASIYEFGILISNVHMAWMRAVCGRLKSDYRYSKDVVYNNFPWPAPTEAQKAKIEQTAQAILDARALYPDSSLADLYDETTMPPELRKAHQENDRAVMRAYGFDIKTMTESTCVAELMKMYQKLTEKNKK